MRTPRRAPQLWLLLSLTLALPAAAQSAREASAEPQPAKAEQLFALANQARAAAGLRPLRWDPALAAAALQHCRRMVQEGPIAHRYGGEPDLTARAGQAGAHFSLIEENIAVGAYPARIHDGWMHSEGHRANLLNPEADALGVAVISSGGLLFAVADYSRAVPLLTREQVETQVAGLLRAKGLAIAQDNADARAYCSGGSRHSDQPTFLMRWQNADPSQLPRPLLDRLGTGRYRQAAVGNCPAQDVEGSFTVYRVAVLLY